jgi:hypothetical protein
LTLSLWPLRFVRCLKIDMPRSSHNINQHFINGSGRETLPE